VAAALLMMSAARSAAATTLRQISSAHRLVLFGRADEPFFEQTRELLQSIGAAPSLIELQRRGDGCLLEDAIYELTGKATPALFVNGSVSA
jgi:hypothetical protein